MPSWSKLTSVLKRYALRRIVPAPPREFDQHYRELLKLRAEALSRDVPLGMIAGNGRFPFEFVAAATRLGFRITAVCHTAETDPALERLVEQAVWIKVGELGRTIQAFRDARVKYVVLAGGISRVRAFSDLKLDLRGALLLAKVRSTNDDVIMRAIAGELSREGIEVLPCTIFSSELLTEEGQLTSSKPTAQEESDIAVGIAAIQAMSAHDIGQVVVVKEGAIVAVEAVEGTDRAILRGGELGGEGTVVVKYAKPSQDMRFDVPTVGVKTIEAMRQVKARVLALEARRSLIIERSEVVKLAEQSGIALVGCKPLVETDSCLAGPSADAKTDNYASP